MKRLLLPLVLALAAGCATSAAFRAGEKAERLQDYDRAVLEYQKALKDAPDNMEYKLALQRARLRAANDHVNMARRLAGRSLYNEAMSEYRLAGELDPNAPGVAEGIREVEAERQRGRASLEEAKARAREKALPGLDLPPEAQQPLGLTFRNASLREASRTSASSRP
jgi:tetratricopeptide (TPR) repeat protein